jgi:hypothetical protein
LPTRPSSTSSVALSMPLVPPNWPDENSGRLSAASLPGSCHPSSVKLRARGRAAFSGGLIRLSGCRSTCGASSLVGLVGVFEPPLRPPTRDGTGETPRSGVRSGLPGTGVLPREIQTPSTSTPCCSARMPKGASSAAAMASARSMSFLGCPAGP